MIIPRGHAPVDPKSHTPAVRQAVKADPLAEHRRQLARTEPSPEILIVLRAMGHRDPVFSALHALELMATAIARGGQL